MLSVVLTILTVILIFVSLFLILVVLAQKSSDSGMGTALGGGAAEAAFGAQTNTVLSKATIYSSILFFVLALVIYLGRIYERSHARADNALPTIAAPMTPISATPAPSAPLLPASTANKTTTPAAPATSSTAPTATTTPSAAAPAKTPAPTK